jgi:hypothetical protein
MINALQIFIEIDLTEKHEGACQILILLNIKHMKVYHYTMILSEKTKKNKKSKQYGTTNMNLAMSQALPLGTRQVAE